VRWGGGEGGGGCQPPPKQFFWEIGKRERKSAELT